MRTFVTGATRDHGNKPEFAGFLSPLAIREFGRYMHQHRTQPDGALRAADNWKNGMPRRDYLESLFRHFLDVWEIMDTEHSANPAACWDSGERLARQNKLLEALCGCFFNSQALMHEILLGRDTPRVP